MNIKFRGLQLHPSYVPQKEGVDKKGLQNNISMKRFNLIAINQLKSVKPDKGRHKFKKVKVK